MSQTRASHHMTSGVLHPYLDRAMKPVCPKFLYPLFIGTQMIVFWGITLVERFAQGEFDYHDEDLHTPIIWHFFVSLPFYLLRATPTLSTLRLISLAQALILPTVITLVTNSTPSPRPLVFQRVVDAIREPSDFGLVCGLNPLAILMAVSFTPGLSCLLWLLILWRLSVKGNHWIGAAVAAGIGLLRAGVMFWVIFVIGWTAHEISVNAPQKLAITNYYPYLFTGRLDGLLVATIHPIPMVGILRYCLPPFPTIPYHSRMGHLFSNHVIQTASMDRAVGTYNPLHLHGFRYDHQQPSDSCRSMSANFYPSPLSFVFARERKCRLARKTDGSA
ncbi:hypothetical protein I314_06326 [Cryptococcus bacillisporus CA1873]|uniref:Uncharacterized protein n=1 Tax=Cryptococcus bacillisporus CA1873 TaxID=1296111 RepID=A0ABR5B2K7_CRYGA|nr:hypothetical protein I314_06326 [Cryptococcus bacillisporus CA1873]|eukprot:KIR57822.1 hypothetical protein I314_06326 [Cryptococcus gattii CA1873]